MKASQLGRGFGKAALEPNVSGRMSRSAVSARGQTADFQNDHVAMAKVRAQLWAIYQKDRHEAPGKQKASWAAYKTERERAFPRGCAGRCAQATPGTDRSQSAGGRAQTAVFSVADGSRAAKAALRETVHRLASCDEEEHRNETFSSFAEHRAGNGRRAGNHGATRRWATCAGAGVRHCWPAIPAGVCRGWWRWTDIHRNGDVTYRLGRADQTIGKPRRMCWSVARIRPATTRPSKSHCVWRKMKFEVDTQDPMEPTHSKERVAKLAGGCKCACVSTMPRLRRSARRRSRKFYM